MNEQIRRLLSVLCCCSTVALAGCVPKECASFNPHQPNWLNADAEAANLATEVAQPEIQPRTHFAAGQLFEQQGDIHKAIIQYRKALAEGSDYVPAHNRLGVLLGRLGRHAAAQRALLKAVELRPDWAFLRNNLGFEYMLQERWTDAEAELRNAIRLKPDFARAHNNLAMVLFKTGRLEEALGEFRQAVPQPDAYYNLGLMFRARHRYRDAAHAFEHVLSLAPNFEAAKVQLAQIAPHLELETALEPKVDMDDWEAVAQADDTPITIKTPESEALLTGSRTAAVQTDEVITEEISLEITEDLLDDLDYALAPCEDEPWDEQFEDIDDDHDALTETPDDSRPTSQEPVAIQWEFDEPIAATWEAFEAFLQPEEPSPPPNYEVLLADTRFGGRLDQQVYLFPDHPLALGAVLLPGDGVSSGLREGTPAERKVVEQPALWEFREVFDASPRGLMPPFDN